MANKRFTAKYEINADTQYVCQVSKTYEDVYNLTQEIDSSLAAHDGFVEIFSSGATKAATTVQSAKTILLKNISNATVEILFSTTDFKNTSSVDVYNQQNVGGGGSTAVRTISMLLPAGDFIHLPNHRIITYAASAPATSLESGCNAGVGTIAIEPLSINSANEYRAVAEISGTTYGGGTAEELDESATISDTTITVDDGGWFKDKDLIMIGSEVMEVESVASNVVTVKRGMLGSTATAHSDNAPLLYFFGNEYLRYDVGKCMTDKDGRFSQRGAYFGYARTGSDIAIGLVPGSVTIGSFYTEGGNLDWGLNGIKASTETNLAASTTYTFHLVCDEFHANGADSVAGETAIAFTTDATDTTFNSSVNSVLNKIQQSINTQTETSGSGLYNKSISISIVNGDVRIKSNTNNSSTRIGIVNVSGTTPFGVGRFPSKDGNNVPELMGTPTSNDITVSADTVVYGPATTLAQSTVRDSVSSVRKLNESAFIIDDGQGNLLYQNAIVGKIDYYKGHCSFHVKSLKEAEFKIYGQSHSAHSGGVNYTVTHTNTLSNIKARSVNPIKNATLEIKVLG